LQDGGASEREVVTSLFPQLGPTQAWRKSLRMGNFLNGHEPAVRETIFSCCYNEMDSYPDGSQRQRTSTQDYYTHRMYIAGTSSDLQVALSTRSFE
jgi:Rab3 GTPase-activating protein catalytic subunit